jgi:CobQ-like glutamine amidotransferase family enzyme
MLMICGLYQLFGKSFTTQDGHSIKGIGLLDVETIAGPERLIGNIVTKSNQFGTIIGYENHSGKTTLGPGATPLGKIVRGAGNNGEDDFEGARYKNVIGSYLHGSLLPKNPAIADWLLEQAAINRYGEFVPTVADDRFATEARKHALKRPR